MTATTAVLGAVGLICAGLFVYPYVIYPLTLRVMRKRPLAMLTASSDGSGFALLFCAFNEGLALPAKLENVRALVERYPQLKVFAFDDGSTDGSLEQLEAVPDLVTVVRGSGRSGKAHGMKRLAALADAEYLIFTDANVLVDVGAVDALARYYTDPEVGGVCGSLHYLASGDSTATEVSGGLYWRLEEKLKELESRTGSAMGAAGAIFSVRAALYPEFPDSVQDDFTVSMSVVFAGFRLVTAPDVFGSENLTTDRRDEARRKIRVSARAYHTHSFMRPQLRTMSTLNRYKYAAHKVLRWWGAIPAILSALAFAACLASAGRPGLLALAALALTGMLVALVLRKPTAVLVDLLIAVWLTLRGVMRARRGETFITWTPPATR